MELGALVNRPTYSDSRTYQTGVDHARKLAKYTQLHYSEDVDDWKSAIECVENRARSEPTPPILGISMNPKWDPDYDCAGAIEKLIYRKNHFAYAYRNLTIDLPLKPLIVRLIFSLLMGLLLINTMNISFACVDLKLLQLDISRSLQKIILFFARYIIIIPILCNIFQLLF